MGIVLKWESGLGFVVGLILEYIYVRNNLKQFLLSCVESWEKA